MCEALYLNHDILAKRNHKGFTVEHFHRFFNKRIYTVTEERGTNDNFVPVGVAASYAWNSTPIDGTTIIRSIPVSVGSFSFPWTSVSMLFPN